jgi:hypothetical protein
MSEIISIPIGMVIMPLISVSYCKESFEDIKMDASNILVSHTNHFIGISDGVTINQQGYRIKKYFQYKHAASFRILQHFMVKKLVPYYP